MRPPRFRQALAPRRRRLSTPGAPQRAAPAPRARRSRRSYRALFLVLLNRLTGALAARLPAAAGEPLRYFGLFPVLLAETDFFEDCAQVRLGTAPPRAEAAAASQALCFAATAAHAAPATRCS